MKSVVLSLFYLVLATSCSQVYFSEPQPQKGMVIKSFINDIQGSYNDSLLNVTVMKNELIVNGMHYRLTTKTPGNDEVMVKYYRDFYFASFKDSVWFSLMMGKFYEDKLAIYLLPADQRSIQRLQNFGEVSRVDSTAQSYLMQLSKKQFDELLDYEMFTVQHVIKKK